MQGENASPTQKKEGQGIFQGWKKFFAPPTMLEQEAQLQTMDPTSRLSFDFVMEQLDILSRSTQDPNMKAQYAYLKADMEIDRAKSKYAEDFVWDFIRWIEGISSKNVVFEAPPLDPNGALPSDDAINDYPIITPWGNKPYTFLPDVKDFLDSIVDKKASVEKFISKLRNRWPSNITELWFWYKYIVHKQAIDGTVIEYATSLQPYEFIPKDQLPVNPEDGQHSYPYYEKSDNPLHPQGEYKGPSFLVKQDTPYNPNPPRYQEVDKMFMEHLRAMINDQEREAEDIWNTYRTITKYNNWAFDRTDLENIATGMLNMIDQVPDPDKRRALLDAFGWGPTDATNMGPVDRLIIQQGIQDAFAQYLQNNPPINVNVNQPQENNLAGYVQAIEEAVQNGQVQNQQNIQELLAAVVRQNPVVAPQVDNLFVGRIQLLENQVQTITKQILDKMNTPVEMIDYTPIKELTKVLSELKIPNQISYSGPLSLGVSNPPLLEVNKNNLPKISVDSSNIPKSILLDVDDSNIPESIKVDTPGEVTVKVDTKEIAREISRQIKLPSQNANILPPPVKEIVREIVKTDATMSIDQFETLKTNIVGAIQSGFKEAGLKQSEPYLDPEINNIKSEIATLKTQKSVLEAQHEGLKTAYSGIVTALQNLQNAPAQNKETIITNTLDNDAFKTLTTGLGVEFNALKGLLNTIITENRTLNSSLLAEKSDLKNLAINIQFLNSTLTSQNLEHKQSAVNLHQDFNTLNANLAAHLQATSDLGSQLSANVTPMEEAGPAIESELTVAVNNLSTMTEYIKQQGESNRMAAEELRKLYDYFMNMMKEFYEKQKTRQQPPRQSLDVGPNALADMLRNGPDVEEIEDDNDIEEPEYPGVNMALLGYFESQEQIDNLPENDKLEITNDAIDKATELVDESVSENQVPPQSLVPFRLAKLFMGDPETAKYLETPAAINSFTAITDPGAPDDTSQQIHRVQFILIDSTKKALANPNVPEAQKNKIVQFLTNDGQTISGSIGSSDSSYNPIPINNTNQNIYKKTRIGGYASRNRLIEGAKNLPESQNLSIGDIGSVAAGKPSEMIQELGLDDATAQKFISALTKTFAEQETSQGREVNLQTIRGRVIRTLERMIDTKRKEDVISGMKEMTSEAGSYQQLLQFTRNYINSQGQLSEVPGPETMESKFADKYFGDKPKPVGFESERTEYFSFLKATDSLYSKFNEVIDTLEACGLENSKVYTQAKDKMKELNEIQRIAIDNAAQNFDGAKMIIDGWKRKNQYEYGGWSMAIDAALNPIIRELQGVSSDSDLSEYHAASKEIIEDLQDLQKMPGIGLMRSKNVNPGLGVSMREKAATGFKEKLKFIEKDIQKAIYNRLENEMKEQRRKTFLKNTLGPVVDSAGKAIRASFPYDSKTDTFSYREERDPQSNQFNLKLEGSDFGDTLGPESGGNELFRKLSQYNANAKKNSEQEFNEINSMITEYVTRKAFSRREAPKPFKEDENKPSIQDIKQGFKSRKPTLLERAEEEYQQWLKLDQKGREKMAQDYKKKWTPYTKRLTEDEAMLFLMSNMLYLGTESEERMKEFKQKGAAALKKGSVSKKMFDNIMKGANNNKFSNEHLHAWSYVNPEQNFAKEFMESVNPKKKSEKKKKKSNFKF